MAVIVWTNTAEIALEEIVYYYAVKSGIALADSIYKRITSQIGALKEFPYRSREGRIEGARELVIARPPYLAVLHVNGDVITVLTILHTARKFT